MNYYLILAGLVCLFCASIALSAPKVVLTPEQKKELKEIGTDAIKIVPLISKKKYDEAEKALETLEKKLAEFVARFSLKDSEPMLKTVRGQIDKVKKQLTRVQEKGGNVPQEAGVSFDKHVAPILARRCVECHGDDPKGGLRLDTFAGMEKGGQGGQLLVPGNPEGSKLIQRVLAPMLEIRMPLQQEPLTEFEVNAIAVWISEGAQFEGDKTASMADLAKAAASKPAMNPKKPGTPKGSKKETVKETGIETVHFMQDIMPELVDTCGRCHNDTQKQNGFSVMSFEKLMKGGNSGAVITAGSLENSRLWRLVNADETPVMPAGNQTGITRRWHANLKTWIMEGAKFDGTDPSKNFPSRQERESDALAKFTPEQWLERRKKAAEEDWKKTFPKVEPTRKESAEFLLYGDVAEQRLEQVEKWASQQTAYLRQTYKVKDASLWRGKLAVFVFKERFGYDEFNSSVHRRESPREIMGHSQVTQSMEDAFIVLQDVGDAASETSPGMQVNVLDQVTAAFFQRGGQLPDWLLRGAGLALASQKSTGNVYLTGLPRTASKILHESNLSEPGKIFEDGTFSPAQLEAVSFAMVQFMLKKGNLNLFGQFVQKIQNGSKPNAAIEEIYRTDADSFATTFAATLPKVGVKSKK